MLYSSDVCQKDGFPPEAACKGNPAQKQQFFCPKSTHPDPKKPKNAGLGIVSRNLLQFSLTPRSKNRYAQVVPEGIEQSFFLDETVTL